MAISRDLAIGARRSSSGRQIPMPPMTGGKSSSSSRTGMHATSDSALWSSSATWNSPSGNYIINYKAILNWIVNTGPNPFPTAASCRQHSVLLVDSHRCALVVLHMVQLEHADYKRLAEVLERIYRFRDRCLAGSDSATCRHPAIRHAAMDRTSPPAAARPERTFRSRVLTRQLPEGPGSIPPITRNARGTDSGSGRRP